MTTDAQSERSIAELIERNRLLQSEALGQLQESSALQARLEALAGRLSGTTTGTEGARLDSEVVADGATTSSHGRGAVPISRRRLLALTGTGIVSGAVASSALSGSIAGATPPHVGVSSPGPATGSAILLATTTGTLVAPLPTGIAATDTANLLQVLSQATPGTSVVLQCLSNAPYVIDQELPIPSGVRLTAQGAGSEGESFPPGAPGGTMATLTQAPNSSLICTVASAAYLAGLYGPGKPGKYVNFVGLYGNGTPNTTGDGAIEIDHIAFDGGNGGKTPGNTIGHAIVLYSSGARIHDCYIFNTPQVGIVVSDKNFAGTAGSGTFADNRIVDNKFFNNGRQAVLVTSTPGTSGCIDGYMTNNIVVAPSKAWPSVVGGSININPATGLPYEAIRFEVSAGWRVANNHPYQVPGSAWYLGCAWGLYFVDNSTDDFGALPQNGATYVGYDFYLSVPVQNPPPPLHPTFINGNQLSAYEGFNTNNHNAGVGNRSANSTIEFLYYRITMQAASQTNPMPAAYLEHSDNTAHQDSQPAQSIVGATVVKGSSSVTFPIAVASLLQMGMSVADVTNPGLIPHGTFVGGLLTGSTISLVDASGRPVVATGSSSAGGDTLAFPGPVSIGWSYVNQLAGSTLVVARTNEIVSPTIDPSPAITGSGGVSLIDPANFAGGVQITGIPQAGQTIVATSPTTAVWAAPPPPVG